MPLLDIDKLHENLPPGVSWNDMSLKGALCLAHGRAVYPQYVEALEGIADTSGEIYSMEGSAADCEPIYIEENVMAHANHHVSLPMRRFEANPNYIGGSILRHNRFFLRDDRLPGTPIYRAG